MARLTRKNNKLFCGNAQQSDVGQFGSLNAGTKLETTDIDTIQSLSAWGDGWQAATLGDNCYPTRQERNGLDYVQSYLLNYLYQEGIPEWSANTTYYKGSIIKLISGTDIRLYKSLKDNNTAALSDTNSWKEWNYANSDLSNLSATGKHVIDGQWVSSRKEIIINGTPPTTKDVSFDLSSYLPNDGYTYEVLFSAVGTTGNVSGNGSVIILHTDLQPYNAYIYAVRTRAASTVNAAGSVILPVGTGRTVSVNFSTNNTGTYNLYAFGYRRIGTNQ